LQRFLIKIPRWGKPSSSGGTLNLGISITIWFDAGSKSLTPGNILTNLPCEIASIFCYWHADCWIVLLPVEIVDVMIWEIQKRKLGQNMGCFSVCGW
jgi:hypothetical protein